MLLEAVLVNLGGFLSLSVDLFSKLSDHTVAPPRSVPVPLGYSPPLADESAAAGAAEAAAGDLEGGGLVGGFRDVLLSESRDFLGWRLSSQDWSAWEDPPAGDPEEGGGVPAIVTKRSQRRQKEKKKERGFILVSFQNFPPSTLFSTSTVGVF